MPNIIPPLVSSSPPPILPENDEEDEFGDFSVSHDYPYDGFSLPTTPQHEPNNGETLENALNVHNDITNLTSLDTLEIKDNESQDSTTSIITPDSGLSSEMSSSIDDQTIISDKKVELLENNLVEEKDYQDVRNEKSDDKNDLESLVLTPSINLEIEDIEDPFLDKNNLFCEYSSSDIIKNNSIDDNKVKDFKDKRKLNTLDNTVECIQFEFDAKFDDKELNDDPQISMTEIIEKTKPEIEATVEYDSKDVLELNSEAINETAAADFHSNNSVDNDDDDEFADFECATYIPTFDVKTEEQDNPVEISDATDLDDFADFSSAPNQFSSIPHNDIHAEIIDLFSKKPNSTDKEILSKTIRTIFTNSFSDINNIEVEDSYPSGDILKACELWDRLEDIDNSKALNFRWEKSEIYLNYLKVINMDSRNILYGPNLNAPRFASNIPLEPIKATQVTTSTENSNVGTSTEKNNAKVEETINPELQFDWNSSGLENPLDLSQNNSMLLDIEELVSSLDNLSSGSCNANGSVGVASHLTEDIHNIDTWEYWTHCNSIKARSKEPEASNPSTFEFSDVSNDDDLNKPKDVDSVKSLQLSDLNIDAVLKPDLKASPVFNSFENNDDDFSEFQACSVVEDKSPTWTDPPVHIENKFSQMNLRETHISAVSDLSQSKNWLEKPSSVDETNKSEIPPNDSNKSKSDDDEFSEFQYVPLTMKNELNVPVSNIPILNVEKNVAVALNATPLQPIVIQNVAKAPEIQPEINWPNPGISEDELNRLAELNFTINSKETVEVNIDCKEVSRETNDLGIKNSVVSSEDDWSDFVSVSNIKDITKKPIIEPIATISEQSHSVYDLKPINSVLHPKPIVLNPQTFTTEILKPVEPKHSLYNDSKVNTSDDDWSDFVSNRDTKPLSTSNLKSGPKFTSWNQPPSFPSWNAPTSFTPNIITNPGHFEQGDGFNPFMAYVPNNNNNSTTNVLPLCVTTATSKNQTHTTLQGMKGRNATVSTISTLPDLDFLTPKTIQSRNTKK